MFEARISQFDGHPRVASMIRPTGPEELYTIGPIFKGTVLYNSGQFFRRL
jgi:hypothetical protein